MRRVTLPSFAFAIALLLQSCLFESKRDELSGSITTVFPPTILVSSQQAALNELVTVTVNSKVSLSGQSSNESLVADFKFGACFSPASSTTPPINDCFEIPDGIVIKDGNTTTVDVKETVKRGELIEIEHSFSFTATTPTQIILFGRGFGKTANTITSEDEAATITFQ